MCGRFVRTPSVDEIVRAYGASAATCDVGPSYNVCPSQRIVALRGDSGGTTVFCPLWGFEPRWRNDRSSLVINARIEGVAERPMFRHLLPAHRCIIPLSGYFEWASVAETIARMGSPKRKVPFYISPPATDSLLTAAGLWQNTDDGDRVVMLTTEATESVRHIHDRMPVLLDESTTDDWLHETTVPPLETLAVPNRALVTRRVGYAVSNARSEGPQLLEPYAGDDQATLF